MPSAGSVRLWLARFLVVSPGRTALPKMFSPAGEIPEATRPGRKIAADCKTRCRTGGQKKTMIDDFDFFQDLGTAIICGRCERLAKRIRELKLDLKRAEIFRVNITTAKGFQMRSKRRREEQLRARAEKGELPSKVVEEILGRSLKRPKPLTRRRKIR